MSQRKVCLVRVKRKEDEWIAAFAVDGRRYENTEEFERVKQEVYCAMSDHRIIAEFETSDISEGARPNLGLPSWEEYRDRHKL
ncbi:hypothetical protein ACFYTQ_12995 [Nocardia sp. NPDC004068]|uniref:hypothetical protein n=1 Tax=Nocardia sp. NPDC004068 TaxID=3364303 RepID=UPI0036878985